MPQSPSQSLSEALREEEMEIAQDTQDSELKSPQHKNNEANTTPRPSSTERKDPDAWIRALDELLPPNLQVSRQEYPSPTKDIQALTLAILKICNLARGRRQAGVDLLTYMGVQHSRWNAVVWLAEILLKSISLNMSSGTTEKLPSNIAWSGRNEGSTSLDELCQYPIVLDTPSNSSREAMSTWDTVPRDLRYAETMSAQKDATMNQIWFSLGNIIIESANMDEERRSQALTAVYRILGFVHNSGLVPEHVYSYVPVATSAAAVQRPPILHLLSSRMLSTLSDAVWRSHSDEVMERAVSQGAQYKDLGRDPPGGRFRLKVKPLGPEIWLELVLWCCVDGGFSMAGSRILRRLQEDTHDPWFAVSWSQGQSDSQTQLDIDWDRVKLRSGGTVGRIEAYSADRPFVEMPSRTISSEVVMALVEGQLSAISPGVPSRGFSFSKTQPLVKSTLSFLEPHRLEPSYFDYVTIRASQAPGFDVDFNPAELRSWVQTISSLKSMESLLKEQPDLPLMSLNSLNFHSEVVPGLLHQCMEGFLRRGDVRAAIEVFAAIQHSIDLSKLKSINSFLRSNSTTSLSSGNKAYVSARADFVSSHGQLPLYQLAGFLNLLTDTRLPRLGHWLVYSEDVDGPLIPRAAYGALCISPSLVHFAALSKDTGLLNLLNESRRYSGLKPSVNFLRSLCSVNIAFKHFDRAEEILEELRHANGGGYHPSNLAYLAGTMLQLEYEISTSDDSRSQTQLKRAETLADKMISGTLDAKAPDFSLVQRGEFRQQISSLLQIFAATASPALNGFSKRWEATYEPSNGVNLSASVFNIFLNAVVDFKGSYEGQKLWDLFCQDPRDALKDGAGTEPESTSGSADWDVPFEDNRNDQKSGDERTQQLQAHDQAAVLAHGKRQESMGTQTPPPRSDLISFVGSDAHRDSEGSAGSWPLVASDDHGDKSTAESQPLSPVVRPDIRTLRTIVRAHLAEMRNEAFQKPRALDTQPIMQWAWQFYVAFGVPRDAIAQELKYKAVDGDYQELSIQEAKAVYDNARRNMGVHGKDPVSISKQFAAPAAISNDALRIRKYVPRDAQA